MSEVPRSVNGKGVARHYDRLEPAERFKLALEAGARDDDRERERLAESAPMRACRVTDPAYMDRVDASRELAFAVALDLAPRIATLRLLTAVPELLAGAFAAGEMADADAGQAAAEETVRELPAIRACREVAARSASESAAVLAAFGEVCRELMELEPDVVLRAHLGSMVEQLGLDELDGVKPDKAALAGWRELLERTWRRRTAAA